MADDEGRGRGALVRPAGMISGPLPSVLGTVGVALAVFLLIRAASEGAPEAEGPNSVARRSSHRWRSHPIFALAWSPDGRRVAASGWGSEVRIWEPDSGIARSIEPDDEAPRFVLGWSADGRRLSVSRLEGGIESWDAVDGPRGGGTTEGILGDCRAFASTSGGNSIRLWGMIDRRSEILPVAGDSANSMAFAPDGHALAMTGRDGVLRVWEAETGRALLAKRIDGVGINSVVFSGDGSKVAIGGGGPARVFDVASGRELASLGDPASGFSALAFSPDGTQLAGSTWLGRIEVWDLRTGTLSAMLRGPGSQVLTLAWSPDGRRLASGGHDATIRAWDLATSK